MNFANEYDELTKVQRKRDEAFIETVRKNLIAPTIAQLEKEAPGYSKMTDYDRFSMLMKMNDAHAPNGEYLVMDLGWCDVEPVEPIGEGFELICAVFSGIEWQEEPDSASGIKIPKRYVPRFYNYGYGFGFERNYTEPEEWLQVGRYLASSRRSADNPAEDDLRTLELFPIPYRIALIALYIRQNVLCAWKEACRFAAGFDEELHPTRRFIQSIEGFNGNTSELFGWSITIRDTDPGNELALDAARIIRKVASEEREAYRSLVQDFGEEHAKELASRFMTIAENNPFEKKARSKRQTTEALEDFLFRYLPSKGLHVKRKGEGEHLKWSEAQRIFEMEYGEVYAADSFRKRCYALLKANRRKVD